MYRHTVALFGAAEKGDFQRAYFCGSLTDLSNELGQPPAESKGMDLAIQALLFQRQLIFFRVAEEGFSTEDYLMGLHFLQNRQLIPALSAICLPGVSDEEILCVTNEVCHLYQSIIVTTESDLYDLLTHRY
ncbi:MAG: hypothetical protein JHC93_02460 [Parachlamydiales bacterium]|nr:hypothetical protein [Parachlamydiales bacterium]